MSHWITNRGKLLLFKGHWDDAAGTDIQVGLLAGASVPVGIDTEAEIQDLNFISDLLAITNVDEPVGGWYARAALTRSASTQDDTNNRVNADASNVTFSAATVGETLYGAFVFDNTGGADSARQFISLVIFTTPIPTNGSDVTLTIADLFRAA